MSITHCNTEKIVKKEALPFIIIIIIKKIVKKRNPIIIIIITIMMKQQFTSCLNEFKVAFPLPSTRQDTQQVNKKETYKMWQKSLCHITPPLGKDNDGIVENTTQNSYQKNTKHSDMNPKSKTKEESISESKREFSDSQIQYKYKSLPAKWINIHQEKKQKTKLNNMYNDHHRINKISHQKHSPDANRKTT